MNGDAAESRWFWSQNHMQNVSDCAPGVDPHFRMVEATDTNPGKFKFNPVE